MNKPSDKEKLKQRAKELIDGNRIDSSDIKKSDIKEIIKELEIYHVELEIQNKDLLKTQEKLQESKTKYKNLFEFAPIGYFIIDKKDFIVDLNLTASQFLGYNKAELLKKNFCSLLDEENCDIFYFLKKKVFAGEPKQETEITVLRKDKTPRAMKLTGKKLAEDVELMQVAAMDISEIKETESRIRKNEKEIGRLNKELRERFEEINLIYNNSPIGLAFLDNSLRYIRVNKKYTSLTGVSPEGHVGKTIYEVSPKLAEEMEPIAKEVLARDKPVSNAVVGSRSRSRPGKLMYWKEHFFPIKDVHGKTTKIIVSAEDITAQKNAQTKLEASENKYRSLFENLPDPFLYGEVVFDKKGKPADLIILEANKKFEILLGISRKKYIGQKVFESFPGLDPVWLDMFASVAKTGKPKRFKRYDKDITYKWFNIYAYSCKGNDVAAIFVDITDLIKAREAKDKLLHHEIHSLEKQKIAREFHDTVSQTLFASNLFSESIERSLGDDPRAALEKMKKIRDLTNNALLEFRKLLTEVMPQQMPRESLKEIVKSQVELLTLQSDIKVDLKIKGKQDYSDKIKQEVYKILREAINNTIKHSEADLIKIDLKLYPEELNLAISDNGKGFDIKKGYLKERYGIDIIKQRAKIINASLKIESKPEKGTKMNLVKRF